MLNFIADEEEVEQQGLPLTGEKPKKRILRKGPMISSLNFKKS